MIPILFSRRISFVTFNFWNSNSHALECLILYKLLCLSTIYLFHFLNFLYKHNNKHDIYYYIIQTIQIEYLIKID